MVQRGDMAMNDRHIVTIMCLLGAAGIGAAAPLPVLDDRPVLQVDAGGSSAAVTALAFSHDGDTLYVAGLDKVVRVWHHGKNGFELARAFRVPLGPGTAGAINAIALSPDGQWLAIAGRAPMRGETGFSRSGLIVDAAAFTPDQLQDAGLIYVASTVNPEGGKVLRGHRGEVRALAFAQGQPEKSPILASTATEREGARRYGGLRLWDVMSGKQLAELTDLPARPEPPPGLVAWHTGPKPEDVRVAVAWPADKDADKVSLRIWDPSAPAAKRISAYEADRFSRPLALLGTQGTPRLLIGGLKSEAGQPEQGRLQIWALGSDITARTVTAFDAADPSKVHLIPDGLAPVSVGADGKTQYAAVLLRPTADANRHLAMVDLESNKVVADVTLSDPDRVHLPVLAASPQGRFVAVADAADHSVQLYAVADLIQGQAKVVKLVQRLSSSALTPRRVAFVDKGRGLWLSEINGAKPLEGGYYFDFGKSRLETNTGKKIADTPALGEWKWKVDPDRKAVRVWQGDKELPALFLKDREAVTAVALRPPSADRSALLAVAFTDRDNARTLIMLCRCEDGVPFRLLIGHLQDVRQLAFSDSRPLLASVSEDQTVCVWSLKDVDQAVGQIQGLGVADVDGKAVVHAVEPGSVAARARLAKGDVIEAVGGASGELHDLKGAKEFLDAIAARRPGAKVQVRLAGKQDPVTLEVGRGLDGRKPLFSLLLHNEPGGPGWVGWSPAGPYDASGAAAEACVGWHTNTGKAGLPVAFVPAGEHRKEYFKPGLLGRLAEKGDLAAAREPDPPPVQPVLQPHRPDKAVYTKLDNVYLIREAVPSLQVGINADYPMTDAHVLKWSVSRADGGKVTDSEVQASGVARWVGEEWQADLKAIRWARGEYTVRLSLLPTADAKSVAAESVRLRFQPSRPTLQLDEKFAGTTELKPLTVKDDKLPLQVELGTALEQKVDLSFGQAVNGQNQDAPKPQQVIAGKHAHQFTLAKGLNRLTVRAVNAGAGNDVEQTETAVASVWVRYEAPVELPPSFPILKPDGTPERGTIDKKDVWIVDRSHVRLDVRIEAAGPLVQADWAKGDAKPTSVLPAQNPGKSLEFQIDLDLKAGEVVPMRLRAKSKNSDVSFADRAVVFRPPLPTLAADQLKSPDCLQSQFTLTGTFKPATPDAFKMQVRVTSEQGQSEQFEAEIDREKKTWKAALALPPGRNKIEAFVRNDWRTEEAAPGVNLTIRYRRPPRIVEAKGLKAVGTAVMDLPLTVESPADLPICAITVEGDRYRVFKTMKGAEKDGWTTWSVVVPQVAVCEDGRKLENLHVLAHNDDGPLAGEQLVQATVVKVTHEELPKPADVRILLAKPFVEPRPHLTVPFRVESDSPLLSAELRRHDEVIYRADLKASRKEGNRIVLEDKPEVPINFGLNSLRLVVVNAGGQSADDVVVSRPPPSARVDLDRVEVRSETDGKATALEKTTDASGKMQFQKASGSLVWLVGHVTWSDPEAKQLDATDLSVVVLVQGCRQFPVALAPRGKGDDAAVRRFQVPMVLTAAKNEVKVEVKQGRLEADQSVGQESLSHNECMVPCAAPPLPQRLHLLIVGATATDSEALAQRVLNILSATDRPAGLQGDFKTEAFEQCTLYRVLVGEQVEKGKVSAQLVEINKEIAVQRRRKSLNDVILIYYQGEDVLKQGQLWLKTHSNFQYREAPLESYAIPWRSLQCAAGAPLVVLNVTGSPAQGAAGHGWGGNADTAVMRYAFASGTSDKSSLVLDAWQRAMRKEALLGDVAALVVEMLSNEPQKPDTEVAIKGLRDRKFGVPR